MARHHLICNAIAAGITAATFNVGTDDTPDVVDVDAKRTKLLRRAFEDIKQGDPGNAAVHVVCDGVPTVRGNRGQNSETYTVMVVLLFQVEDLSLIHISEPTRPY